MGDGAIARTALVLAETRRLLLDDIVAFSLIAVLLSAAIAALDVGAGDYAAMTYGSLASFLCSVLVNYRAVRRSVPNSGVVSPRFAAFFGMSLLSGIAILAGLLLLIVSGLLLYARWFLSGPLLVGANDGIISAMRRSWNLTRGYELPAILFCLVPVLVLVSTFGLMTVLVGDPYRSYPSAFVLELLGNASILLSYVGAVACWNVVRAEAGA